MEETMNEFEKQQARDRILAREVGIEIGRRREQVKTEKDKHREFAKGFYCGFALAVSALIIGFIGAGYANAAPTQKLPPHADTWLAIAKCEQPKSGGWGKWGSVDWHQTRNYTYPGGAGMTRLLWKLHKRTSQKHVETMDQATPLEQIWAMYRFWKWAEKTYPGAGYTGWECSADIGWTSSNPEDAIR